MAIVTISQIKHRRGIKGTDPMPQLASAELGWAIDEQGLYIGNGTIAEGAPTIGNTEILTEHSSLSVLISDYIYTGPFDGAVVPQTGPIGVGVDDVERPQNDRLDDNVSVRAFGAIGDGVLSDLAALDRAIQQGAVGGTNRYWTTIYVPAGTYDIDGPLQLPSNVRLVGDGYNSTIINRTDAGTVLEIGETGVETNPSDIYICGIGFTTEDDDSDVAVIRGANNVTFDRVSFNGIDPNTLALSNQKACVLFTESGNDAANPTFNIKFVRCLFTGNTYGIASDIPSGGVSTRSDISDVVVENCAFDDLYKAIVIGKNADTTTYSVPSGWRISLSVFDNITRHGIHCYKAKHISSAMNHFADVGNNQAGVGSPATGIIVYGDTDANDGNPLTNANAIDFTNYQNCYSIGDTFDRDDADDLLFKRVTTNARNSYSITPFEIFHGTLHVEPGRLIRLLDDVGVTSTGLTLDSAKYQGAIIDYQITRSATERRIGTLTLSIGTASNTMMDDFIELAGTVDVTFSTSFAAGVVTLNYTAGALSNDATFSYSIRHLTNILAIDLAATP